MNHYRLFRNLALCVISLFTLSHSSNALALDLDWAGQFRAEAHMVNRYTLGASSKNVDTTRQAADGYYIAPNGNTNAHFQTLFLRLNPKVVVNDNVYIKSEWWVGDPVYGFFGNAYPQGADGRQYNSTQSRGSMISAQRFWAEFLTDFGMVQVGRVPLHWGLGLVWNQGSGLSDRYPSTGDAIRLTAKFGAFSFSPGFVKYSAGNTVSGACNVNASTTGTCTPFTGSTGLQETQLAFKYDNSEEDFEAGLNFVRRTGGGTQDTVSGIIIPDAAAVGTNSTGGVAYNIWDVFMKKRIGKVSMGAEAPISTGKVNGIGYSSFAVAGNVQYKMSESWTTDLNFGQAPGQENTAASRPGRINAFYFHPDYRPALIMFNYALQNFAGIQTQNNPNVSANQMSSVFYNPVTNARFVTLGATTTTDKWKFYGKFIYATALKSAQAGSYYFNQWSRHFVNTAAAASAQQKGLGWEWDMGTTFQWDDHVQFGTDLGFFAPGQFYKFSNTAVQNPTGLVWASNFRIGVNF